MKRICTIILTFALLLGICGCSQLKQFNFEDLEIYQSLKGAINENDTLEQIVDTFAKVCEPLLDDSDNRYQYETIAYDVDGTNYLKLHLATQFKVPVYTGTLQLNLVLVYQVDEDLTEFEENKWIDHDFDAFIDYIKSSNIFQKLTGKTVDSYNITIDKA